MTVVEFCPNCETEVEMQWDVKVSGYKAYCPHCGGRLMLCDACLHPDDEYNVGKCDYCAQTDSCKHNDNRPKRDDEFKYILGFVKGADLDDLCQYHQLIALWTAFCLHHDLIPDTFSYDTLDKELWDEIVKNETNPWKNGPVQLNIYQKYCLDMMQFLV